MSTFSLKHCFNPQGLLAIVFIALGVLFPVKAYATTNPNLATSVTSATVPALAEAPDTTTPTIPILIAPPDGTLTDNSSPTFTWRRSTDPNGNTVFYTLYLNDVATYSNIGSLGNTITSSYTLRLDGDIIHLTPTSALEYGSYSWSVTASDLALNTSHSATWHFTLDTSIPAYTATISQIPTTRYYLPILLATLLALALLILLIILWRRRYNLILTLNSAGPVTIYHSLPPRPSNIFHLTPDQHGRLYIPHLTRYSTLTIRIQGNVLCTTYILSICGRSRLYTIVLG